MQKTNVLKGIKRRRVQPINLGATEDLTALLLKADQGDAKSQFNLAKKYEAEKKYSDASKYYKMAADEKNKNNEYYPLANCSLGEMCENSYINESSIMMIQYL